VQEVFFYAAKRTKSAISRCFQDFFDPQIVLSATNYILSAFTCSKRGRNELETMPLNISREDNDLHWPLPSSLAVLWIRITLMGIRIQIKAHNAQTLKHVLIGSYSVACRLQINADPNPVPELSYHYDADPDFYLMRIQVTKMMRIWMRIRIHRTVLWYDP
jgi:hypothetical protein